MSAINTRVVFEFKLERFQIKCAFIMLISLRQTARYKQMELFLVLHAQMKWSRFDWGKNWTSFHHLWCNKRKLMPIPSQCYLCKLSTNADIVSMLLCKLSWKYKNRSVLKLSATMLYCYYQVSRRTENQRSYKKKCRAEIQHKWLRRGVHKLYPKKDGR